MRKGSWSSSAWVQNSQTRSDSASGAEKRPPNAGSILLSETENETLFSLIGLDCISLAAGVVQLLKADPKTSDVWIKSYVGILAYVKDYKRNIYYLRIYDIHKKVLLWQQMFYKNFRLFSTICPNLLTFEGDDSFFGLNFSVRDEADNLKYRTDKRYENERMEQQKNERLSELHADCRPELTIIPGLLKNAIQLPVGSECKSKPINANLDPISSANLELARIRANINKKKKKRKKIKIIDIGYPTDFRHNIHIGFDGGGRHNHGRMSDKVKNLINAAGKDPNQDFSYRFTTEYQQSPPEIRRRTSEQPTAPPPLPPFHRKILHRSTIEVFPARQPQNQLLSSNTASEKPLRSAPSAAGADGPSCKMSSKSPSPTVLFVANKKSSVAPEPSSASESRSEPPPAPPLPAEIRSSILSHSTENKRASLLSEIRESFGRISLKPVRTNFSGENSNTSGGTQGNELGHSKGAETLKPVNKARVEEHMSMSGTSMEGIIGALARALEQRRKTMGISDDSSDEVEASEDDSEWERD